MNRLALCTLFLAISATSRADDTKDVPPPKTVVHEPHRLSDALRTLIEMSAYEDDCQEEIQRMYDMLRKLDTNKDGKIDPKELKAASHRIMEERIDALIKRTDTDKDGKISREEAKGRLKELFDEIDKNKDGFIDREELMKAAEARDTAKAKEVEKK